MVKLGNFLFHYRNFLFPVFYLLLFISSPPIFRDYKISVIIGLIIAFAGQAIRAITVGLQYIIRGGRNRRIYAEGLVTSGIFSHCRNPLYIGNILIILGLAFVANSLLFLLMLVPVFIFFYQAIVLAEENFLLSKFNGAFEDYKSKVNRWLPKFRGISSTLQSMEMKWQRIFIKEYTSAYVWITGAVLLIMKNNYLYYGKNQLYNYLLLFIGVLLALLIFYLTVRYFKKTKKWTGD
ncbi:MAG: isoprenylcysteine carboxylmethyltransferase family protein [Chitinophagales bacterium]|nr:isoprenylcysteine carboxylmethyltransferase family protein [Chitinophagales bacterium]